jgi:regulator of replication initiation timing
MNPPEMISLDTTSTRTPTTEELSDYIRVLQTQRGAFLDQATALEATVSGLQRENTRLAVELEKAQEKIAELTPPSVEVVEKAV